MAAKNSKNKKQIKTTETKTSNQNRAAQIVFAAFAIILILSMVLSAIAKF
ncbi:MAG: hypothetical protein IH588_02245 [Anaerolineales bacterium]|nr:hypothetical protein [Anaerolineales bacterium]